MRQRDSTDCGPACLLSLLRYYGGDRNLETIREWAGTTREGTTLLGLYQAALKTGFNAKGCESSIDELVHQDDPLILHVLIDGRNQHYIVCYPTGDGGFILSDPASGISYVRKEQLDRIWLSKKCLLLTPSENFIKTERLWRSKIDWTRRLIQDDYVLLCISTLLGILLAMLGLVMATFTQKLVDNILPSKNADQLVLGLALVLALLLIQLFISSCRKLLLLHQSRGFNNRIIDTFYSSLLHLPKSFFDNRKIGDLIARLNDTGRIQRVITQIAGGILIDGLTITVTLFAIFFYSGKIAFISLASLPLYFTLMYSFKRRIIEGQRAVMRSYAQSESNLIDSLQGVSDIKARAKQRHFSEINRKTYGSFQETVLNLGKINIKLVIFTGVFGILFLIGLLAYMSFEVLNGNMKTGEMIALLTMEGILFPSVSNLGMVSIPISEASIAFDRMFEFISIPLERGEQTNKDLTKFETLILKEVSFGYPGRKPILQDASYEMRKGEIISMIGESGCGKSTLVQLLQKFYQPQSGQIIVNSNINLTAIPEHSWNNIIGVVPQYVHIFNGTVLQNIGFPGRPEEAATILQFCKDTGIHSYINALPQGYNTIVGEEGINLSGGQKQIIGFARALLHSPQLLILDEATSAMDRRTESFFIELIKSLRKELAVILVSHRLYLLQEISDRIYLIEDGKLEQVSLGEKDQ